MSMNKYMHPRNIYKSPPNFKQLALDYPEFRPFVKWELSGKVTLDFKDLKSLRALSCILLKKDFGLEVEIPVNKLIPTIPLRLNYILWLEDLLSLIEDSENFRGIDIGTGASCVYPLLGAKKNKWTMVATEVDEQSIQCAQRNVERNSMGDYVKIVQVNGDTLIKNIINDETFDFCMCNPPFFGSSQELNPFFNSRKITRPKPKNSFCASANEVIVQGGEVEFVEKLIRESKDFGRKIKIYTTMIGHKKSLPHLKKVLRDVEVSSFQETFFCQGNTTRWGLSWTFCAQFDLKKYRDPVKQLTKIRRPKEPLVYVLPVTDISEYSLNLISKKLLKLFAELQMVIEEVSRKKNTLRYFLTAFSNTWSNQRRKRREKMNVTENNNEAGTSINGSRSPATDVNDLDQDVKSPGKRTHDDCFHGNFMKKLKISTNEDSAVFLNFVMSIKIENERIILELDCSEQNDKRDTLYQIMQYVKNNLKLQD